MRPTTYEIHVSGIIAAKDVAEFAGMSARFAGADTFLAGLVADQAALAGMVARVEALGCTVKELRVMTSDEVPPGER